MISSYKEIHIMRALADAKEYLMDAKSMIEDLDLDEPLQEWEECLERTPVHKVLGSLLVASEDIIKARLKLTDAMWNMADDRKEQDVE